MMAINFVQRFYASADGPALVIEDRLFTTGIEIYTGPTYGRILFLPTVWRG